MKPSPPAVAYDIVAQLKQQMKVAGWTVESSGDGISIAATTPELAPYGRGVCTLQLHDIPPPEEPVHVRFGAPDTRPNGPKLVVTGSRKGRPDVVSLLDEWVRKYGTPELVICGDAEGVDSAAAEWAREHGYDWTMVKVNWRIETPRCFYDRNTRMVKLGAKGRDHLMAFPLGKSPGTWNCYNAGRRHGLICHMV